MSDVFERSIGGVMASDTTLECGVCWWEFDPKRGDEDGDIEPGTAFTALPEHWRCPQCDAPQAKFMVKSAGTQPAQVQEVSPDTLDDRVERLLSAYRKADKEMEGLPIYNDKIQIDAIGFRTYGGGNSAVGVIITPWCMNLTILPEDGDKTSGSLGSSRQHGFPSGNYSFVLGRMDNFGLLETCSLFSPMDDFEDHDAAQLTAHSAIEALMQIDAEEAERQQRKMNRRSIIGGGRSAPPEPMF